MVSNEELCEMAQSGNEDAANQLFLQNEKYLHLLCHKYSDFAEHDELFDILQIGFVKAMQGFEVVKGYKFLTYANNIMTNEVLTDFKARNRQKRKMKLTSIDTEVIYSNSRREVLLTDALKSRDIPLEELMIQKEQRTDFYQYLNTTIKTELERTVIHLYLKGKKQKEIDGILGSHVNVSRMISRIMGRVQKKLQENKRITA